MVECLYAAKCSMQPQCQRLMVEYEHGPICSILNGLCMSGHAALISTMPWAASQACCTMPAAQPQLSFGASAVELTWSLPRSLNVISFSVVDYIPEKKTGHNQEGTSLEPLGGQTLV